MAVSNDRVFQMPVNYVTKSLIHMFAWINRVTFVQDISYHSRYLLVEVPYPERLLGATVEPGGFARYALKKIYFRAINIGNDKKKNIAKLYVTDS